MKQTQKVRLEELLKKPSALTGHSPVLTGHAIHPYGAYQGPSQGIARLVLRPTKNSTEWRPSGLPSLIAFSCRVHGLSAGLKIYVWGPA